MENRPGRPSNLEHTKLLSIVYYPHPTLRYKSKPVKRVDTELRAVVREMFERMYEARGIGLAANQVDLPLRLFVLNLEASPDEGEELVFINPVISRPKGNDELEEGCLSMPGVNGLVRRPETVHLQAFDLSGNEINATVDGLFARAVQHELDHLEGVLFTDRMSETGKITVRPDLEELEVVFQSQRDTGSLPGDEVIRQRLRGWEDRYCR